MKSGRWIVLCCAGAFSLAGQTLHFSDGATRPLDRLVLRGNTLIERTALGDEGGAVERVRRLADVVRVDWPEPSELREARQALERGEPRRAMSLLAPLRREHAPYGRVPGAWWTEIMRLQLRGLLGVGPDEAKAAAQVARELAATTLQPEAVHEAHLALAELEIRDGRPDLAEAMLAGVETRATSARLLAAIQIVRADLRLARRQFEEAAEAYLRVWVFYATESDLLPRALQGAVAAFELSGNETQAARLRSELARLREDAVAPAIALPTLTSTAPDTLPES